MIDVDRPAEAPLSLAKRKSYKRKDVLAALYATFLGKCYLCESRVEPGTFQVEHRKPKGDVRFGDLTYSWRNLFPACKEHDCNQRRPRYPDGGLLDPGDGVETRIVQRIEGDVSTLLRKEGSADFVFHAADPSDIAAENTARELHHIHNEPSQGDAVFQAHTLRMKIFGHVMSLVPHVFAVVMEVPKERHTLAESMRIVREAVSRRAPYTMLVRSYFAHIPAVRALFD